jgi:ribosomal protein S18 acetylase RimI-like enzyme
MKHSILDMPVNTESAEIIVERLTKFENNDLGDLCDATEATVFNTYGFSIGFQHSGLPERQYLEAYFRGVLIVPERELFVVRYDGVIAGSIQLVKPSPNNKTSAFACSVDNHFVAPWARGHGLAKKLLEYAEDEARRQNFAILKLSVRATREAAINLYKNSGYNYGELLINMKLWLMKLLLVIFFIKTYDIR